MDRSTSQLAPGTKTLSDAGSSTAPFSITALVVKGTLVVE
jgi:hypothetical protein